MRSPLTIDATLDKKDNTNRTINEELKDSFSDECNKVQNADYQA